MFSITTPAFVRVTQFKTCSSSSSSSTTVTQTMKGRTTTSAFLRNTISNTIINNSTKKKKKIALARMMIRSGNDDDTLSNLSKLLPDEDDKVRKEKERERLAEEAYKEKMENKRLQDDLQSAIKNQQEKKKKNAMSSTSGEEGEYDFSQKSIAALCYMLPLLDSLKYSKFLLIQFPLASLALLPLKPIIELWFALGFLQIAVFFGMYLGVIQNQNMSRFVRFNAQQAILLDILLILPDVLTRLFAGMDGQGPTDGLGLQAEVIMFNSVFLFTYISCLVGSVSATSGKTVRLPLIGDASDQQTR